MNSEKGVSRLSLGQFTLFSILLQLLPFLLFLLVYGFDNCISYGKHQICWAGANQSNSYSPLYPYINYFVFFGVIMINAIQTSSKSELLSSALNVALVIFIWSETRYALGIIPVEYVIFLLCLTLTIPIRLIMRILYRR